MDPKGKGRNFAKHLAGVALAAGAGRLWDRASSVVPNPFSGISDSFSSKKESMATRGSRAMSVDSPRRTVQSSRRGIQSVRTPLAHSLLTRTRVKKMGAVSSKSAGKIRNFRRVKRRTKKFANYKSGVVKTVESGSQITDLYALYLQHHSAPVLNILQMIGHCLAKRLVEKYSKVQVTNMREIISTKTGSVGAQGGVSVKIEWYTSPIVNTLSDTINDVVALNSVEALGSWIALSFPIQTYVISQWEYQLDDRPLVWRISMYSTDNTVLKYGFAEINLRTALFDVYVKTSLKMQNRSASALGTEADEVDNIPLYGKAYECSGSAFKVSDTVRSGTLILPQFIATQYTGLKIVGSANETSGALREPPQAGYFANCKSAKKIRIEPGHIKTSVMVFKKRMFLHSFLNQVGRIIGNFDDDRSIDIPIGKSRMFGLEKILESTTGSAVPAVSLTIGYEHNIYMNVAVIEKNYPVTAQLFEKI